jgi:rhomboid protease GluP
MLLFVIGAMVTLYGLALLLQPEAILRDQRGLSPGGRALYQLGMTGGVSWELGWWWTIVTAIYLHAGLLHLVTNLLYVYALGAAVVEIYGHPRMFVLFNIAGASGFLLSNVAAGAPSVGASGGYAGLAAGLLLYGRRRGTSAIVPWLWWCCVGMAIFTALSSHILPQVNGWALTGGLIGGWVAALLLGPKDIRRESITVLALQLVFSTTLVVGVVLSFLETTSILIAE